MLLIHLKSQYHTELAASIYLDTVYICLLDEVTPVTDWFDLQSLLTMVQRQTHLFPKVFADDS